MVIAAAVLGSVLIVFVAVTAGPDRSSPEDGRRDPAVLAEGRQLFLANCAACHGADLMGTNTGPPFLHPYYAPNHHGDEAFQQAVARGVVPHHWNFGPMDPVPGLDRGDVSMIVAFIRAEQEAAGIFFDPSHP